MPVTQTETKVTGGDVGRCDGCGQEFEKGRVVQDATGRILRICPRCDGKMTKKWWQFWK